MEENGFETRLIRDDSIIFAALSETRYDAVSPVFKSSIEQTASSASIDLSTPFPCNITSACPPAISNEPESVAVTSPEPPRDISSFVEQPTNEAISTKDRASRIALLRKSRSISPRIIALIILQEG